MFWNLLGPPPPAVIDSASNTMFLGLCEWEAFGTRESPRVMDSDRNHGSIFSAPKVCPSRGLAEARARSPVAIYFGS